MQAPAPAAEYVPGPHDVHAVELAAANAPAAHEEQLDEVDAPTADKEVPAGQLAQLEAPDDPCAVPGEHPTQALAPAPE